MELQDKWVIKNAPTWRVIDGPFRGRAGRRAGDEISGTAYTHAKVEHAKSARALARRASLSPAFGQESQHELAVGVAEDEDGAALVSVDGISRAIAALCYG